MLNTSSCSASWAKTSRIPVVWTAAISSNWFEHKLEARCQVQLHRSYGSSRQDRCIKHHETIIIIYNTIHNETLTAEDDIFVPPPFDHRVMQIRKVVLRCTSRHFGGSVGQKMAARLSQTAPLMGLYTWNAPAARITSEDAQDATGTSMSRIKGIGIHSWFALRQWPRGQLMTMHGKLISDWDTNLAV